MKKIRFVVAAVMIGSQLQAQRDSTGISLDEVVLSSNKYPKKQSETGKVITVISREQIGKSGGKTISELLNTMAGITMIGANNNPGTNITASIRGAAAGNVLILIDGIPVNDPSVISNYFDLNFISLGQVERIEILKGGQSTLYGSDAVAGVINIISRKGSSKKINLTGNATVGSYQTVKQSAGLSGQLKTADYSFHYTHLDATGFSSAYDANKTGLFDKDGYKQHTVNGRTGFMIGRQLKATLFGLYSRYKTALDEAAFTDDRDFTAENTNKQAGTGLVYSYKYGTVQARYSYNKAERNYLNESLHKPNPFAEYVESSYTGRTHFVELYGNLRLKNWELLLGGDYRFNNTDQSYYSEGAYGPYTAPVLQAKMDQLSAYASVVYKNEKGFITEAGSRINFHSEYGANITFTFNPAWRINTNTKVFANLYSSFKTPTLYQLFDAFAGNTGLEAEKGIIAEAGAEILPGKPFSARLVGFYRSGKDVIVYTYNPTTFESRYRNAARQTNYGAELEATYQAGRFSIRGNYTYTNGKTSAAFDGTGSPLSKDTSYYNLYRIPKHALNINAGWQATTKLFVSALLHTVTKRAEFVYAGPPEIVKGYTTADLYGEYQFDAFMKFFLDLRNITGTRYFDFTGFSARRFNFTTGVSFQL
jgi:vitamin B12 transporter